MAEDASSMQLLLQQKEKQIEQLQKTVTELQERDKKKLAARRHSSLSLPPEVKDIVTQLEDEVYSKSEELVKQAEKTLSQGRQLEKLKAQFQDQNKIIQNARSLLFPAIIGSSDRDLSAFDHVQLDELVRIHLRGVEAQLAGIGSSQPSDMVKLELPSAVKDDEKDQDGGEGDEGDGLEYTQDFDAGEGGDGDETKKKEDPAEGKTAPLHSSSSPKTSSYVNIFEQERRRLIARSKHFMKRIEELERLVKEGEERKKQLEEYKEKALSLAEKLRQEKELREREEMVKKEGEEKLSKLSEHIEKLMVHLKHEAAAKAKALDLQRKTETELEALKARNALLAKKNQGREDVIQELKEGAKVLEDQLRLMDDKYIQLRNKLDYTRAQSQKEIKRLEEETRDLRMRLELAATTGLGGGWQLNDITSPSKQRKAKAPSLSSEAAKESESRQTGSPQEGRGSPTKRRPESGGTGKILLSIPTLPTLSNNAPSIDENLPWSDSKVQGLAQQVSRKR